ncbi:MAG: hypothetical protein V4532_08605, partial [Pseudomonadota bacterium]
MILSLVTPTALPSALAVLAYGLASLLPQGQDHGSAAPRDRHIWAALSLGWLAQAVSIAFDTFSWDSPHPAARFGFAPALSVTSWL